jgi:hypothetical protein
MSDAAAASSPPFGPWNPGIASRMPDAIRGLCTFLRPENVVTVPTTAIELRDLTGLDLTEVVAFRPERLALHEVLIRVTADLSVPDGSRIEDLGINFRRMTRALLARCVEPRMDAIAAEYAAARGAIAAVVLREVAALFAAPPPAATKGFAARARRWLGGSQSAEATPDDGTPNALRTASHWEAQAHAAVDPLAASAYRALARVVSALLVRHGRLWGGHDTIAALAIDIAANQAGSDAIGHLIDPWLVEAARAEGYRRLPAQKRPVVMNTKGASASGKSTLRPLQKALARDIGVDWAEFALISPDIWRKQLLDYGSLGPHYKYAGAFTGEELRIVDQKLDRYMAQKAARGEMPHLLIDRFRFDSFAPDSDEAGSNLLTRFGQILYLFFMITPPASLVERAWKRGLDVGRYKAVDDTLAHGVEAYSGMPELFFTWVARTDKRVHFEFLDNSVELPERPCTVAFGTNDTMNILDIRCLLDVERYRRVDVDAASPDALYADRAALDPSRSAGFLRQCVSRFRRVDFAEQGTGRVYLRVEHGRPAWSDRDALARAIAGDDDARAGLTAAVPGAFDAALPDAPGAVWLAEQDGVEPAHTLGDWGGRRAAPATQAERQTGVAASAR